MRTPADPRYGLLVRRRCGNRPCCNPAHLFEALNAIDSSEVSARAHVQLGVVEAERLDLDHRVAVFRLGLRDARMTSTSGPPNPVLRIARTRNPPQALQEQAPPV